MKLFIIILFFLSIIMVVIGYFRSLRERKNKVEYRFIDKTLSELYKEQSTNVYKTFRNLFTNNSLLT